jgi:hypothetical protein
MKTKELLSSRRTACEGLFICVHQLNVKTSLFGCGLLKYTTTQTGFLLCVEPAIIDNGIRLIIQKPFQKSLNHVKFGKVSLKGSRQILSSRRKPTLWKNNFNWSRRCLF